ncbi:MAG: type II toxin-antitoxin system HicA family toxin [Oscillospiraceae bacterium]|nr:type II toxin-antitoxin system HicA family toxin [Oscillospiraceae bacterium]
MTGTAMIKWLKKQGYTVDRIKGSHYHISKNDRRTVVPHHHKELHPKTYSSILKDLGIEEAPK